MAQSLSIVLTVTTHGNGLFSVAMSSDPNSTLPPHTSVSPGSIQLGAATEDVEYSLEFSFLSPEFEFDGTHPILWPYPPGTELPILFSFGHATSTSSQCSLPVVVRHLDGQPSHGFAFFFNIVHVTSETGPQTRTKIGFVADPTIVTDPDPG